MARLQTEIDKDDAYWTQCEQVVSDVLAVMGMRAEELLSLEVSDLPPGVRDFKTITEEFKIETGAFVATFAFSVKV